MYRDTDIICSDCKFNPKVTISTTDAKKKYRLTNEEINDAELFNFSITYYRRTGYKYLLDDIRELAENIFAGIDDDDKRKQKYLENINDEDIKSISIDNMHENVQGYFEDNDIEPDDDLIMFVEKIVKKKHDSEFDVVIGYIKRKIRIDNLINEHDDMDFIERATQHEEYDAYIYDNANKSAAKTFNIIKADIEDKQILLERKKKLNEFIEKKFNTIHADFAINSSIYRNYTTDANQTDDIKVVQKDISEHVEEKIRFDARKKDFR